MKCFYRELSRRKKYLITELNIAKEEYKFLQTRIEYELKIRRLDNTRGKA